MSHWLDSIAEDIVNLEHEIRTRLRLITYGKLPDEPIELGAWQARTLLRWLMPARYANSRMRKPHARIIAALGEFAAELVTLNEPCHDEMVTRTAACRLIDELREWIRIVDWTAACRLAKVKWPAPPVALTDVMRLQAAEHPFPRPRLKPGSVEDTPAGRHRWRIHANRAASYHRERPQFPNADDRRFGTMNWLRDNQLRRELETHQGELDLVIRDSPNIIDIRQFQLPLQPIAEPKHADDHAQSTAA